MYNLVSQVQYETLWRELVSIHPEDKYLVEHKARYYELFDHLAFYLRGYVAPTVLEVGVSAFTQLYKQLFPHISLVTLDRPLELYGADASHCIDECRADRHYNLDLNKHPLDASWGQPPLGTFDYVVFCEVLEHLVVNPVQLIGELLGVLNSNGYLYLTTPNFFSLHHLRQILWGENPQSIFPRRGEDKDSAHHYREYVMPELVRFVECAGGKIVKAYYSDCWEDERSKQALADHPELLSNLSIVASCADANVRIEHLTESFQDRPDPFNSHLLPLADPVRQILATQAIEIARLEVLVGAYESGRFMRFMKWLHDKGLGVRSGAF